DAVESSESSLGLEQLAHLGQEPTIYAGKLIYFVDRQAFAQRVLDLEDPLRRRLTQRAAQRLQRIIGETVICQRGCDRPARPADLQRAQRLLERFLEGASDGHRFADGFHL